MSLNGVPGAELRLEHLAKAYGTMNAVAAIELSISRGEFFTILGPSGSGKTTILMLIAGFTAPSSGEIYINSRPVSGIPAHKRNIGVVFQNYGLFPHMTVAQNVAFPLTLRGHDKSEIADSVDAMLEIVQLAAFQDHMPHQLSGGQQQRVALARALVFRPNVLLLDEPLSALDRNLREQMQIELKEIHQALGTTIVFVTHDQSEALALSDRIAVLNGGLLEQVGTPANLYERPDSRFVASFIGESNIISGRCIGSSDQRMRVRVAGGLIFYTPGLNRYDKGVPVEVVVRPQHIQLGQAAGDAVNSFEGTVKNKIYSGDSLKIEVVLNRKLSILARVPNTAAFGAELKRGDHVIAGFSPEHVMVFPMDSV